MFGVLNRSFAQIVGNISPIKIDFKFTSEKTLVESGT